MNLIDNVKNEELQNIRFVLTDMDETLTYKGRLQARTYQSLEMLQHAGLCRLGRSDGENVAS